MVSIGLMKKPTQRGSREGIKTALRFISTQINGTLTRQLLKEDNFIISASDFQISPIYRDQIRVGKASK